MPDEIDVDNTSSQASRVSHDSGVFMIIVRWVAGVERNEAPRKIDHLGAPLRYDPSHPLARLMYCVRSGNALQHRIDCSSQNIGRVLQSHPFFRPQVDFDMSQNTGSSDNGRDRDAHIPQAVGSVLE